MVCDVLFLLRGKELTPSDSPHTGFVPALKEKKFLTSSCKKVRTNFFVCVLFFVFAYYCKKEVKKKLSHLCKSQKNGIFCIPFCRNQEVLKVHNHSGIIMGTGEINRHGVYLMSASRPVNFSVLVPPDERDDLKWQVT